MTDTGKALSKLTVEELQADRAKIEAELLRRMSIDPAIYGCCGRMPCQWTACPVQFTSRRTA